MVTFLDEAGHFLVETSEDQLLVVVDVASKEGKFVPLNVLLSYYYFLVLRDIEHLDVVVMRNHQQGSAVILEAYVIDPSAQAVDREQYFIHGVNVFERPLIGVIFHLGLDNKRVLGVAEAAGDNLNGEVSGADGEEVGAGVKAEGSDGGLGEVVARGDDPAVLALVEVADCEGVAGRPQSELPGTGRPLRDKDGQLDIDVHQHFLPLCFRKLPPYHHTAVVAGGYDLPIGRPVDVADGLGVLRELLQQQPGIDLCEVGDSVKANGMVFLGGEGAVGSIEGEGEGGDAVGLPHSRVAYFCFHDILFIHTNRIQSKE